MSPQDVLNKYRNLLEQKAELQKRELDIGVEILVCEKEIELTAVSVLVNNAASDSNEFIEQYKSQLEPDDYDFLSEPYRGTKEVSEKTFIPATSLKRLAEGGKIEFRKTDRGHFRYSTVSVLRYLIDVKAEEES